MQFRNIPSLSRLMDVHLKVKKVAGSVKSLRHMQSVTVSIPTEEVVKMTGDEMETLYLRPMVKALAEKINTMGDVMAAELPMPKDKAEVVFSCTKGAIPVMLRVVRRGQPDRHQLIMHTLIEPVEETENDA